MNSFIILVECQTVAFKKIIIVNEKTFLLLTHFHFQ